VYQLLHPHGRFSIAAHDRVHPHSARRPRGVGAGQSHAAGVVRCRRTRRGPVRQPAKRNLPRTFCCLCIDER
jgi:hypothetical protein